MDTTIDLNTILAIAGAISTLGGAWLIIRKINADNKKTRDLEAAKILQEAKEEVNKKWVKAEADRLLFKQQMEAQISEVQADLDNYKEANEKDLQHLRETYNGEIRNLGTKIEDLRSELRNQHGQLVGLLTKMIDSRD